MKKFNLNLESLFHSNLFLQIVSVVVGVLCWYYGVTVIYPDTEGEFHLTVDLSDQKQQVEQLGLNIIGDSTTHVTVRVKGQRFLLFQLQPEDLNVTASLDKVSGPGSYTLSLSGENDGLEYLSITPNTIDAKFDVFSTKTIPVEVELSGLNIPEGYLAEEQQISPETVTVSGPDEVLSRIDRCVFSAALTKPIQRTTTVEGGMELLDRNGNEITSDHITLSQEQATLTIPIMKVKELPFTVKLLNAPPSMDVEQLEYSLSSSALEVAGPAEQIDRYTELVLGYVDLKELMPDEIFVFDVADALPEGFVNVQGVENVIVEFSDPELGQKYLTVDNFQLLNKSADYDITVRTTRLSNVLVYGRQDLLDELVSSDLVAEIDLSSREIVPGQFTTGVTIYAPNKEMVWVYGSHSVIIHVTEKPTEKTSAEG